MTFNIPLECIIDKDLKKWTVDLWIEICPLSFLKDEDKYIIIYSLASNSYIDEVVEDLKHVTKDFILINLELEAYAPLAGKVLKRLEDIREENVEIKKAYDDMFFNVYNSDYVFGFKYRNGFVMMEDYESEHYNIINGYKKVIGSDFLGCESKNSIVFFETLELHRMSCMTSIRYQV